jgi:hypothetical protein
MSLEPLSEISLGRWMTFDWLSPEAFSAKFNVAVTSSDFMVGHGLVTSAAGLPSLTYSRTIRDDQNQL